MQGVVEILAALRSLCSSSDSCRRAPNTLISKLTGGMVLVVVVVALVVAVLVVVVVAVVAVVAVAAALS